MDHSDENKNKRKKRYPWYVLAAADLLLTGVILCTFAYFHHVRMLWGIGASEDNGGETVHTFRKDGGSSAVPAGSDPTGGSGGTAGPSGPSAPAYTTGHIVHDWQIAEVVEPTCSEGGYTRSVCTVCGEERIGGRTGPLGHDPAIEGAVEPTDEAGGYTGDTVCKRCGEVLSTGREIPATSHKNVELRNERPATCTQKGYSGDWYCSDCGRIVAKGSETPMSEHEYEKGRTVAPTCQAEGYTVYTCKNCGASRKADYTDRTEHDFKAVRTVAPTCQAEGYTLEECVRCKSQRRTDPTPKTGHKMGGNGRCTVCGAILLDTSGDFGASFPAVFIQDTRRVSLSGDEEISAYAAENGLSLRQNAEGKYIALYRSHDIFLTIQEINTTMDHPAWAHPYAVQYYVYDIYVRNIENLFAGYTTGERADAGQLMEKAGREQGREIVAAVNGDYMGNLNHCLLCERNGKVLRDVPGHIESDICVLYYDGTMETYTPDEYDWKQIEAKNPYQIWNFGPGLIGKNGKAVEKFDHDAYDNNIMDSSHPRTSIGYYEPGHYNFVIVDGRSDDSHGCRMSQLAQIQQSLGCKTAYNLDGGDSTQAYFGDGVIRKDEEREEQRKLFDLICVGEVSGG